METATATRIRNLIAAILIATSFGIGEGPQTALTTNTTTITTTIGGTK